MRREKYNIICPSCGYQNDLAPNISREESIFSNRHLPCERCGRQFDIKEAELIFRASKSHRYTKIIAYTIIILIIAASFIMGFLSLL